MEGRVPETGSELCDLLDSLQETWFDVGLKLFVPLFELEELRTSYPNNKQRAARMLTLAKYALGKRNKFFTMQILSDAMEGPKILIEDISSEEGSALLVLLQNRPEEYFYQLPMQLQLEIATLLSGDIMFYNALDKLDIGPGYKLALRKLERDTFQLRKNAAMRLLSTKGSLKLLELKALVPNIIPVRASPLAEAVATSGTYMNVNHLFTKTELRHFCQCILLAMDETEAWLSLLKKRSLLAGAGMEALVSELRTNWERQRSGEPSKRIITEVFATMEAREFLSLLNSLCIGQVSTEVVKLTSWLDKQEEQRKRASEQVYEAQSTLRQWLLKHQICEAEEVDVLIPRLAKEGVSQVKHLNGFDKDDLKACGFTTRQAIAIVKAVEK